MGETWYKAGYDNSIKEVSVIKETGKQIVYKYQDYNGFNRENRTNKNGQYDNYFKTLAEAKQYLIDKSIRNVKYLESSLQSAQKAHQELIIKLSKY